LEFAAGYTKNNNPKCLAEDAKFAHIQNTNFCVNLNMQLSTQQLNLQVWWWWENFWWVVCKTGTTVTSVYRNGHVKFTGVREMIQKLLCQVV